MAAPTITDVEVAISLRLHTDPAIPLEEPIAGLLGRLLSAASAIIDEYSGDGTPIDVCDQAAIELVGYWYDKPTFTRLPAYSFRNSGAQSTLSFWRDILVVAI